MQVDLAQIGPSIRIRYQEAYDAATTQWANCHRVRAPWIRDLYLHGPIQPAVIPNRDEELAVRPAPMDRIHTD